MPRSRRQWISQQAGSYHIISRTSGAKIMLNDQEKEYFLALLERFASGFFVQIHAFCIMDNHFHILANGLELEAKNASAETLINRYRLMFGESAEPPAGTYDINGDLIPDADGGIARLRERLSSISRFVQELKQTFSHWYNKRHNREGYLWSDRFKGILVENGEAQTVCSAYIDLNPVRAKMVEKPEDYRWGSLGLRVRNPVRAKKLLGDVIFESAAGSSMETKADKLELNSHGSLLVKEEDIENESSCNRFDKYREFVYISGGMEHKGKGNISPELLSEVKKYHGKLGIGDSLRYRVRNISEGLSIGSHSFISGIQEQLKRKYIRPRAFMQGEVLYCTRVLRS
ncbi:MAG TPA: transposase [Candidatus Kapabacteria bacterium]|nr:transposase [Candidatus Kapabacteria bacterium]